MKLAIIIPKDAKKLTQFGAREIKKYLGKLIKKRIPIYEDDQDPPLGTVKVILGCGKENRIVRGLQAERVIAEDEKLLPDDGYIIKSIKRNGIQYILIAARNPNDTLYASYKFIELFGVRFNITGDVLPKIKPDVELSEIDIVNRPRLKIRGLAQILNMEVEPKTWKEHTTLLNQMAKMGFNFFAIGFFYRGEPEQYFEYKGLHNDRKKCQKRQKYLNKIFNYAHSLGIKVGIGIYLQHLLKEKYTPVLSEIPEEFKNWSEKSNPDWRDVTDPARWKLEICRIRQLKQDYPSIDYLMLFYLECPGEYSNKECDALEEQYIKEFKVDPSKVKVIGIKGNISRLHELHLFRKTIMENRALVEAMQPTKIIVFPCFTSNFNPIIDKLMDKDLILMSHSAYATWPNADAMEDNRCFRNTPYRKWIWDCLGFDMIQDYPQACATAHWILIKKGQQFSYEGIAFNFWRIKGYEHIARFISESIWEDNLTPPAFYKRYVPWQFGVTGNGIKKMVNGFMLLEDLDRILMSDHMGDFNMGVRFQTRLKPGHIAKSNSWKLLSPFMSRYKSLFKYRENEYFPGSLTALKKARRLFRSAMKTVKEEECKSRLQTFIIEELDRNIKEDDIVKKTYAKAKRLVEKSKNRDINRENLKDEIVQIVEDARTDRLSKNPWWSTHYRFLKRHVRDYWIERIGKILFRQEAL